MNDIDLLFAIGATLAIGLAALLFAYDTLRQDVDRLDRVVLQIHQRIDDINTMSKIHDAEVALLNKRVLPATVKTTRKKAGGIVASNQNVS